MDPSRSKDNGSHGEPDLESLLQAIVIDDRAAAQRLIKKHPALSAALVAKPRLYESKTVHWLYANDTALHLAAAGHRVEIARRLLRAGADPNACRNHRQSRPLHYAADGFQCVPFDPREQVKTIRVLLKAGADIHAVDKNGATALHRAVRTRSAAAVEFLLESGADPSIKNRPGATPFHLAVQSTGRGGTGEPAAKAAQQRIIESMLAHNVSPMIKDGRGKSVLDWATNPSVRQWIIG